MSVPDTIFHCFSCSEGAATLSKHDVYGRKYQKENQAAYGMFSWRWVLWWKMGLLPVMPCTRDHAMACNFYLNVLAASFFMSKFECSAESALPDAGCSLWSADRKRCTRRVDAETLAVGHLQGEIISRVAWDRVVCSSCKKPNSHGMFLWLLGPLRKSKNMTLKNRIYPEPLQMPSVLKETTGRKK